MKKRTGVIPRLFVYLARRSLKSSLFQRTYLSYLSARETQAVNIGFLKLCLRTAGFNETQVGAGRGEFLVAKALSSLGCESALDIGANFGDYSSMLLEAGFKKVHAFEPHPVSFSRLARMAQTSSESIVPHQSAMGESRGKATLGFDENHLSLASLAPEVQGVPYVEFSDSVEVDVETIDDFYKEVGSVDFVKIDTEGFERQVLLGAARAFSTSPPCAIQVEFNHHHLFSGVTLWGLHQVIGSSYSVFRILPGMNGAIGIESSSPYGNVFAFSNYVFVRNDMVRKFDEAIGIASL